MPGDLKRRAPFTALLLLLVPPAALGADGGLVSYEIRPSDTDPAIRHFDEVHCVVFDRATPAQAQLAVFMPGTDGRPTHARKLLEVIAGQGYRVIGLEYNDEPAVVQSCPRDPSPDCSGEFRRKRIFGEGVSRVIDNTPAESILNRLTKLLAYLEREHPGEGWGGYLKEGAPDFSRMVVSGLSQGAGMAAYLAKRVSVARVVLFSSPWDYYSDERLLAPWLTEPSATPPERWFAEVHRRERTAALILKAYEKLRIPPSNILVFDLPLPQGYRTHSDNPFHGSTIQNPGYAPDWRALYGRSP